MARQFVTLRETYDLSTKPNKMTLIAVHTPSKNIITRLWPGFCMQYKYVKIIKQNVYIASQARLPLDPANIGANKEGAVSAEDVFNPILYRAVSNQSLSNLEYRIRGLRFSNLTVSGESVDTSRENVTEYEDEFNIYYSILQNSKGWRASHPMKGVKMTGLRPLVFEKWYSEGVNMSDQNTLLNPETSIALQADQIPVDASTSEANAINKTPVFSMRGKPHRMPSFNTKFLTGVRTNSGQATGTGTANGMAPASPYNFQNEMPDIPTIYDGLILCPPSRNTVLYYRLVVETVIRFTDVQDMSEIAPFADLNDRNSFPVYWNDYRNLTKDSELKGPEGTLSVSDGADIEKRMETAVSR